MPKVDDWAADAAKEISSEQHGWCDASIGEGTIAEVIVKHCPFKPDVAYMPVPRCDGCKHWAPLKEPDHTWSDCLVLSTGTVVSTEGDEVIQTRKDFGCVQWEAK